MCKTTIYIYYYYYYTIERIYVHITLLYTAIRTVSRNRNDRVSHDVPIPRQYNIERAVIIAIISFFFFAYTIFYIKRRYNVLAPVFVSLRSGAAVVAVFPLVSSRYLPISPDTLYPDTDDVFTGSPYGSHTVCASTIRMNANAFFLFNYRDGCKIVYGYTAVNLGRQR